MSCWHTGLRDGQGLKRGDKIPGSKLSRDFCRRCFTPMRAAIENINDGIEIFCEECAPGRGPQKGQVLTPRQCIGLGRTSA